MKQTFRFIFSVAFFAVVFFVGQNASAQGPIVGGYKDVAVNDEGVVAASKFAMDKIAEEEEMDLTFDSVLKAQQQVVQGKNYRIFFKVIYADGGENYELCLNAQVYRSLKNEYSLSSWDSAECPE